MARLKGAAPPPKTDQFVMRLSEDDKRMLVDLAEARAVTGAEVVRSLIRKEHARIFKG